MNPFDLSWTLLVLFLAALPWFIVIVFAGLPRFTIAQIGWITAIIAFALAGPRLRLHAFYVLALVVIYRRGNGHGVRRHHSRAERDVSG